MMCVVQAADWEESEAVAGLFDQAGIKGTFVLLDPTGMRAVGYNRPRAETRFIPASTFKIPNSLIGLATGAVSNVDDVLPYQGPAEPMIKAWANDMGLRQAIALSNVPIYQTLARRIGLASMREHVERLHYGNMQLGATVDQFWLQGPLQISALEQTEFLRRLAGGSLPYPVPLQAAVREIVLLEVQGDVKLYGKTGWQNAPDAGVGWWVGWVERDGKAWPFALNMDIRTTADAGKRLELGKASLKLLGVYGTETPQ